MASASKSRLAVREILIGVWIGMTFGLFFTIVDDFFPWAHEDWLVRNMKSSLVLLLLVVGFMVVLRLKNRKDK